MFLSCQIKDIAYYLPEKIVSNMPEGGEDLIEKLGIRQRHVAGKDEHVSDLAVKSAQKLFEQNSLSPQDIDALVMCTQTPDRALPGPAFLVHEKLKLSRTALAFDYNHGCT